MPIRNSRCFRTAFHSSSSGCGCWSTLGASRMQTFGFRRRERGHIPASQATSESKMRCGLWVASKTWLQHAVSMLDHQRAAQSCVSVSYFSFWYCSVSLRAVLAAGGPLHYSRIILKNAVAEVWQMFERTRKQMLSLFCLLALTMWLL